MQFWIGMAACMAAWLGLGWAVKLRVKPLMSWLIWKPRGLRVFLGTGGLIGGMGVLAGGMLLIALGGGAQGGIQLWAWPLILLLGMVFISIQVLGACSLASLMFRPPSAHRGPGSPAETT